MGVKVKFFTGEGGRLFDCDVLGIDSKYFRNHFNRAAVFLEQAGKNINKLIWFDTTDSSGCGQFEILPYVNSYLKFQILRDKALYLKPFYGNRIWTDYYHRYFNINDDSVDRPRFVTDKGLLAKIGVSWSPGLADYSLFAPLRNSFLKYAPLSFKKTILSYPNDFMNINKDRPIDVSCRVATYNSPLLSFQRYKLKEALRRKNIETTKISRGKYFQEIHNSKIVISPFGWGEVTLRDFEVFLSGAILMKPDMEHLETWPDFYRQNDTVIFFDWDLKRLEERLDTITRGYSSYISVAAKAQDLYKKYIRTEEGYDEFCMRVKRILEND